MSSILYGIKINNLRENYKRRINLILVDLFKVTLKIHNINSDNETKIKIVK